MAVPLIPEDVTAGEPRFVEVIRQFLLSQGELLEARHLVPQHLDVGETVGLKLEFARRCLGTGHSEGDQQQRDDLQETHVLNVAAVFRRLARRKPCGVVRKCGTRWPVAQFVLRNSTHTGFGASTKAPSGIRRPDAGSTR